MTSSVWTNCSRSPHKRRAFALRELEHHRETLAAKAQKAADEFAEAEFKVVGDCSRADGDDDERLRSHDVRP